MPGWTVCQPVSAGSGVGVGGGIGVGVTVGVGVGVGVNNGALHASVSSSPMQSRRAVHFLIVTAIIPQILDFCWLDNCFAYGIISLQRR